ncbi:MAG: PstS family phosphate ABC transporter substrate-binding protein, partial [Caldilineaceae bacterium]
MTMTKLAFSLHTKYQYNRSKDFRLSPRSKDFSLSPRKRKTKVFTTGYGFFCQTALLLVLLTGCGALPGRQATPTTVLEDVALQRFLTRAPQPLPVATTPTPAAQVQIPSGLPLPLVDPLNVTGNLRMSGSSALAPLTRRLYADFVSAGYRDTLRIEEVGADIAFAQYCAQALAPAATVGDAIDIVMTDRPIKQSELNLCVQQQRRPVALRVALAALVIVTGADAVFADNVSKAEAATLFTAHHWSDVRRAWPTAEIQRAIPTMDSMIFQLYVNKILAGQALLLQNAPATTFLADGQEIAFRIADTPYTVGFLSFADYQQNADSLRPLALAGVAPTGQNINSGVYALTYSLLLYTDAATLAERPQ